MKMKTKQKVNSREKKGGEINKREPRQGERVDFTEDYRDVFHTHSACVFFVFFFKGDNYKCSTEVNNSKQENWNKAEIKKNTQGLCK